MPSEEAARAPQAQLPVLHMIERRKGRMPDAPGHAPVMGSARNGNPHAGLLYPAVKCNFDKYRRAVKVYPERPSRAKIILPSPRDQMAATVIGTVFAGRSLKQSLFHRNLFRR